MSPPLREEGGRYKIDLVAWNLNWMDNADGDAVRARHAYGRIGLEATRKRVDDGFYRTLDEVHDNVYNSRGFLSSRPGKVVEPKPPRPFRRPVKLDLSSPLAAYRSALLAKAEGDGDAMLRCYAIVDKADRPSLAAYARFVTTTADLEEAAVTRFGAAGAKFNVPVPLPHPRQSALSEWPDLSQAEEALVINGDEATLNELDEPVLEFVRVGEQWKLRSRPKATIGNKDDEEGTDWATLFTMVADAQARFAREIAAGNYANVSDAQQAVKQFMASPTTAPLG